MMLQYLSAAGCALSSLYYFWFDFGVRHGQAGGALIGGLLLAASAVLLAVARPARAPSPIWFASGGAWRRPVAWQGWLVLLATLALLVATFAAVDSRSHSASDSVLGSLPVLAVVFALASLLVNRTTALRPAP